jgi:hypothetical protein
MKLSHTGGYAAGLVLSWLVFPIEAALVYAALEVTATASDSGMCWIAS